MDASAPHYGDQRAIITSCEILNENDEEVHSVKASDPFRLKIDFEIKDENLDEIVIGMGIYTLDRMWLFGTNTEVKRMTINCAGKKRGSILFTCEPLRLITDLYILQCSIQDKSGAPCDFYNEYSRFNVVDTSKTAGYFNYDCEWEIQSLE